MSFLTACFNLKAEYNDDPLSFWQGIGITGFIILLHQSFLAWGWV